MFDLAANLEAGRGVKERLVPTSGTIFSNGGTSGGADARTTVYSNGMGKGRVGVIFIDDELRRTLTADNVKRPSETTCWYFLRNPSRRIEARIGVWLAGGTAETG